MDTNFDSVDSKTGYKKDGIPLPVNIYVQKTVGTGKDFETLHEALKWAEGFESTKSGAIELTLDDGTHYIGEPDTFDQDAWTYYLFGNLNIILTGASSDPSLCIVTLPSTDDGDNYPTVFTTYGGDIFFSGITFDMDAGSYPYPSHVSVFAATYGGSVRGYKFVIKNCGTGIYCATLSYCNIWGYNAANNSVIDNCEVGISVYASICELWPSGTGTLTISNCTTGIKVQKSGIAHLPGASNYVFDTNTADTNVTINEIQYDGSYVANGTSAMSFKA